MESVSESCVRMEIIERVSENHGGADEWNEWNEWNEGVGGNYGNKRKSWSD